MTTTTDPDYLALLRGVLESPNDDLPRLVLADWLEEPERAGTVLCPMTSGTLCPFYLSRPCPTCNGTGYVSNGNAERAEFLRNLGKDYEINADAIRLILCGSMSADNTH